MQHYPSPQNPAALNERLGGPIGRRARVGGIFFNPLPWAMVAALLNWALLIARQLPCVQEEAGHPVNNFLRLCYSDIPILFQSRGMGLGKGLLVEQPLEYPVLIVVFIVAMRWLTAAAGSYIGPDATSQQQLDAANSFFAITAFFLGALFLLTIWVHIRLGDIAGESKVTGVRVRSWDAILIAASPLVMLSGLINWDFLVIALTSYCLLFWARSKPFVSGVFLGLAFAAKFYPLVLIPALFLLCLRADKMRAFVRFMIGGVVAWSAVNVPYMAISFTGWKYFWTFNVDRGADLGSIWYMLKLAGLNLPHVSAWSIGAMALCGLGIVWLTLRAPMRPRLVQVALLILIAFLAFNKVYSPQYMLWLLPFVVLARPKVFDVAVWTIAETLYYLAIWGFLQGILGIGSGADRLYWLSILLRVGVQFWIAYRIINDILQPWQDPVREPYVDDPAGGVLDHAVDAPWMLRPLRASLPAVPRRMLPEEDSGIEIFGVVGISGSEQPAPTQAPDARHNVAAGGQLAGSDELDEPMEEQLVAEAAAADALGDPDSSSVARELIEEAANVDLALPNEADDSE